MSDDEIRDLLAVVALDALDPVEQEAFDRAIAGRPDLLAELDELRAVVAMLADTEATEPPVGLKASILAQIAVTQQSAIDRHVPAHASNGVVSPRLSSVLVAPAEEPNVWKRRRWPAVLAVAAGAVGVIVGAAVWIGGDSSPDLADRVAAVLELPDVEPLGLHGDMDGVRIMHSPSSSAAVLVADGMPDPGDDRDYQLWLHHDGVPSPADVFRPDGGGHVEVLLEDFSSDGVVFTVTVEPAGGSEQPTGPALVSSA